MMLQCAPARAQRALRATLPLGLAAALLTGCASGDFGRVRPSLVADGIHDWLGGKAARDAGRPRASLQLTDDERQLRDLAYPLLEPPYDRERWDTLLLHYGIARSGENAFAATDRRAYGRRLMERPYRSAGARYAQLIDDIRNDGVRAASFFEIARRVLDMDARRAQALAHLDRPTAEERTQAVRRMHENRLVIAWVQHALAERIAAYRDALERMVVATPFPMAADADRSLRQLQQQVAASSLLAPPRAALSARS
jgi:hypothetical protein